MKVGNRQNVDQLPVPGRQKLSAAEQYAKELESIPHKTVVQFSCGETPPSPCAAALPKTAAIARREEERHRLPLRTAGRRCILCECNPV